MGINENLGTTRTIVRTYSRPFPPGVQGELIRDNRTGLTYRWSQSDLAWIAYGTTEQDVTLYVDGILGDDANDGAAATPLLTLGAALLRLPPEIRHNLVIDVQDNAGVALTYEETLVVENFHIYSTGSLDIVGKHQIAAPATGPGLVAADPANTGDWRSLTVAPDPGWTVGDLQGRLAIFTAGPRTGEYCIILNNTSDTIYFGARADAALGQYGPNDGLEIHDITTLIQNTDGTGVATLSIHDVKALEGLTGSRLGIQYIKVLGEIANSLALELAGPVNVFLQGSTIEGLIFSDGHCGGNFTLDRSGLIHGARLLDTLLNDLALNLNMTGLCGSMLVAGNGAGGTRASIINSVFMFNALNPDHAILTLDSVSVYMASCYVGGSKGGVVPVSLRSRSNLLLDMPYGNIIEDSAFSGIQGSLNCRIPGSGTGTILLGSYDALPPGEFENDFTGNLDYGLDLTGQYRLIVHTIQTSTVPNGTGGCRLRWGAYYEFAGATGDEPTISGASGEVDFDDRTPAVWQLWTDDATGLETLTQMRQNPCLPT